MVVVVDAGVVDFTLLGLSTLVTRFCSTRNGSMEDAKILFLKMSLDGEIFTSPKMLAAFTVRLSTSNSRTHDLTNILVFDWWPVEERWRIKREI